MKVACSISLTFIDSHVRFAETKNAALLAANGVVFGALMQMNREDLSRLASLYAWFLSLTMIASAVIILLSFLPVTRLPWLRQRPNCLESDSLLFFGDCHKYTGLTYLEALRRAGALSSNHLNGLHRMYAEQIIHNSRSAWRKFSYFRAALLISIAGLLTPLIAVLVGLILVARDDVVADAS
jgi:hypothetical protein